MLLNYARAAFVLVSGMVLLLACSRGSEIAIYKLPCENSFPFRNDGPMNGPQLTLYYSAKHSVVDTALKQVMSRELKAFAEKKNIRNTHAVITCFVYEDVPELRRVTDCESVLDLGLHSGKFRQLALVVYDLRTGKFTFSKGISWPDGAG